MPDRDHRPLRPVSAPTTPPPGEGRRSTAYEQGIFDAGVAEGLRQAAEYRRHDRAEWTRAVADLIRRLDVEDVATYARDALAADPQPASNGELVVRILGNVADRITMSTLGGDHG